MADVLGDAGRTSAAEVRRVIWTEPAQGDLRQIRAYIGEFSPLAAQRMAQRLMAAANSLAEMPERGRALGRGRRELVVIRPYLIRYRTEDDAVVILRIRH